MYFYSQIRIGLASPKFMGYYIWDVAKEQVKLKKYLERKKIAQ